ncbi:flagellar hook protein FlgE, partial [Rhizobium ruizarguesonis]
ANRLSTVADHIATVHPTGYTSVSTSFSSLVLPSSGGHYNSGGVQTSVRQSVSEKGDISSTTPGPDLSLPGASFFLIKGS